MGGGAWIQKMAYLAESARGLEMRFLSGAVFDGGRGHVGAHPVLFRIKKIKRICINFLLSPAHIQSRFQVNWLDEILDRIKMFVVCQNMLDIFIYAACGYESIAERKFIT